jgi:hypothetical protein
VYWDLGKLSFSPCVLEFKGLLVLEDEPSYKEGRI